MNDYQFFLSADGLLHVLSESFEAGYISLDLNVSQSSEAIGLINDFSGTQIGVDSASISAEIESLLSDYQSGELANVDFVAAIAELIYYEAIENGDSGVISDEQEQDNENAIDEPLPSVDLSVRKIFNLDTVESLDNNGDGSADQFIAKPSDQFVDSFVEYTLVITNNGTATAQNVLLTEDLTPKLPLGLEFDQFIDLDGGTAIDTDQNLNTIEVRFSELAAGESREVTVRAKIDALKAFEFSSILGNIDANSDLVNGEIPEYINVLLQGKFYLSPNLEKEAGSNLVNFNHLNIQNTATVTSDGIDSNILDNVATSRLDITTIALDGELNNGSDVTIRSVERLGVLGSNHSYALSPNPVLINGQKLLQFGVTNPFEGFGLNAGGTVTFEIREVSGTAGADGIFGNADDTGAGTLVTSFNITDGGATDLDRDISEIIAEWAVDPAFLNGSTVFKLTTSTSDTSFGLQQFVSYFDVDGEAIPANTVDTTNNSFFINTSVGESEGVLVQANVTNPFAGFGLIAGGTTTFTISEVTGTAGADGIFGNADDNVAGRRLLQTLDVTDGSGLDLDLDATEVSAEFLIARSLTESTNKVFAITTTVNDLVFGVQTFTNYFDINGQAVPANIVDTTTNSLFINVALNTVVTANGDTGFPTYNNSNFLLSGDLDGDGVLDQFGGSLSEFIWNKLEDDPEYLAALDEWNALDAEVVGEQAIIDFLFERFFETEVFNFENFQLGAFTLENETGDRTDLEILNTELTKDDGQVSLFRSVELLVNDDGVSYGDLHYASLEDVLQKLSFDDPVRLNVTFEDSDGDGKVATQLRNIDKGLNIEKNWYLGAIKIGASVTEQALIYGGNGKNNAINLSGLYMRSESATNPLFVLEGGNAKDKIIGSVFDDLIKGNNGKDELLGFDGNDQLIGGLGLDILNGGRGNDVLSGGGYYVGNKADFYERRERNQKDLFVFEGNFGDDLITDFGIKDQLDLSDFNLQIADFDTNGDRLINSQDNSVFVGMNNGELFLDLTSVGGGTILFDDVQSIKTRALIL